MAVIVECSARDKSVFLCILEAIKAKASGRINELIDFILNNPNAYSEFFDDYRVANDGIKKLILYHTPELLD